MANQGQQFFSKDYGLIIKERGLARVTTHVQNYGRKKEILIQVLPWVGWGAIVLRNTLLDITLVSFSLYFSLSTFSDPPSRGTFLPFYSHLNCIPTFHLKGCWSLFKYLSHHCLAGGGRVGYRLWGHCSGAHSAINALGWVGIVHWIWR